MGMAAPVFVIMNVASPALDVQTPLDESTGAGGGATQVDISAVAVRVASLGLVSVYVLAEPVTVMVVLAPAANWMVEV